jgi:predicted metal-dependent hydrolase
MWGMGRISAEIRAMLERFHGQEFDAHYLAFFECFNQGLFFEAHEVLEKIWLPQRKEANGAFYKGLIQLAGAFVHLQKGRLRPAGALLKLARANLERYRPIHECLDVNSVLHLTDEWLEQLNRGKFMENSLESRRPSIKLIRPT